MTGATVTGSLGPHVGWVGPSCDAASDSRAESDSDKVHLKLALLRRARAGACQWPSGPSRSGLSGGRARASGRSMIYTILQVRTRKAAPGPDGDSETRDAE